MSKLGLIKRALTSTRSRDAIALMKQGFACPQVVFSVFAPDFGLDRDMALRISQGFIGGRRNTDDNVCGAVNGAIMAIGLQYASPRTNNVEARKKPSLRSPSFCRSLKNCTAR